jgi:hypothetical protein
VPFSYFCTCWNVRPSASPVGTRANGHKAAVGVECHYRIRIGAKRLTPAAIRGYVDIRDLLPGSDDILGRLRGGVARQHGNSKSCRCAKTENATSIHGSAPSVISHVNDRRACCRASSARLCSQIGSWRLLIAPQSNRAAYFYIGLLYLLAAHLQIAVAYFYLGFLHLLEGFGFHR